MMSLKARPPMMISLLSLLLGAAAQGTSKDYPPGWNKEATTPPMGWRSWNAFGANINNETFVQAISVLTARVWIVDGKMVSFADVGYSRVGIDEGWENCSGPAPNEGMRQHDEQGFPMVNADKFPNLKSLVDYGHRAGIQMGWYLNGCACGEKKERMLNYVGDVQRLHEYGFDAVKLDGCGAATNMTRYAELMAATGQTYEIENCHWGHCGTDSWFRNPDGASCPTATWCPFNHFRTSGDINAGLTSWLANLQTTTKFQDADAPLSVPGCWAYPDMMEVGRIDGGDVAWSRAHFGAWCVVSAPLILGLDLTDIATLAILAPFLTNPEAIAVNQQWAGHPGRKVLEVAAEAGQRGDASGFTVQVWVKPQLAGKVAVYVVNPTPNSTEVALPLVTLGLSAKVLKAGVRDLWARKELGDATAAVLKVSVPSMDSVFLMLTPQLALPVVNAA
jgi:alpha-galactosidase